MSRMRMLIVGLLVALLASVPAGPYSGSPAAHATTAHAKKFTIALANSYIGNKWRIEMENVFKAACAMPPYKNQVNCLVYNSGNDVSRQSQQMSNLISKGVDAILIDAASPTGLNGIIGQACARGILVVSYDNLVTAPCAVLVNVDQKVFGRKLAQYLATMLHGKGNVIMVTGVAGTTADTDRNTGADSVWKNYPGIKVVNRYTGMWDSSVAQRNSASLLPSLPKKVDGIWCQGGTDGVLKAFIAAGRKLPITAGEAENGFRKFMVGYMGHKVVGISQGQPPFLSVISLELARKILLHQRPKKSIVEPFPFVTNQTVKVGKTVFPSLPDSFFADFTDSGPHAAVKLCVQAALNGTACPGRLQVNLPS